MDAPSTRDFFAQAEELIEALFADLEVLRQMQEPAGRARRALVDTLFRRAHTLKGSSASLPELESVTKLAHVLEDLFDAVRAGVVEAGDSLPDACEDLLLAISEAVAAASRGESAPPASTELMRRARQVVGDIDFGARPDDARLEEVLTALPAGVAEALNEAERRRLRAALSEGARVALIEVTFELSEFEEAFRRLGDAVGESGEIVATLPGAPAVAPTQLALRLLCATTEPFASLSEKVSPYGGQVFAPAGEAGADDERARFNVGGDDEAKGGAAAAGAAAAPLSVRVPLTELDELVFVTDELFDETMAALEHAAEPGAAKESAARIRRDFLALVERVMALRMQTLGRTLERAARAARVAARKSGKEVELEIAGSAARVDRAAAERVAGPLAHLLRNAVDHGIESPAERLAAGKPPLGRVMLEARAEGSRVRVRVSDDGRGIDLERVARAARAAGLLPEGASLEEWQALRLIFRPGFSTAAEVSEGSGRGVGLDAVEHEIERAGGEVRVRTSAGRGTTFELYLPLTLALIPALLVRAAGQTYALDAAQVADAGSFDAAQVSDAGGLRAALWRGRPLPFVNLRELLGQAGSGADDAPNPQASVHFFVARGAEAARARSVGWTGAAAQTEGEDELIVVAVDEHIGRRDVLVRSLGRHATRWRGVSGAVDLRDGAVALALDLPRLFERFEETKSGCFPL